MKRVELMSNNKEEAGAKGFSSRSFIDRSLNLNLFWLKIKKEHALFLRLGLPCDKQELIERARFFEESYDRLLSQIKRSNRSIKVLRALNEEIIQLTVQFIEFKTELLIMMLDCRLLGYNYPLLIDHVRRESIRYVQTLKSLQQGKVINPITNITKENVFWTKIMADHSKFISHLLDPSERFLIEAAEDFSEIFDELYLQAVDFKSFLSINPILIPSLRRFNFDVINRITELINFKSQAQKLISNCEIISLIPELLANHVKREAERYLQILENF